MDTQWHLMDTQWHIMDTHLHHINTIWVGFTRTGILPVSCHLKKTLSDHCGQTWFARPLFSTVLRKAWLSQYTTSASTIHQCTTMHCNALKFTKMHCFFLSEKMQCIFVHSAYIAVHCSELMGGCGCGIVHAKACSTQNNWEKWPSKSGLATTVTLFLKLTQFSAFWFFLHALQCIAVS